MLCRDGRMEKEARPGVMDHSDQGVQYTSLSSGERFRGVSIMP